MNKKIKYGVEKARRITYREFFGLLSQDFSLMYAQVRNAWRRSGENLGALGAIKDITLSEYKRQIAENPFIPREQFYEGVEALENEFAFASACSGKIGQEIRLLENVKNALLN